MRRARRRSRFAPYAAGLAAGYIVTLAICAAAALLLSLAGKAGASSAAAVTACCAGSFVCGRVAGALRGREGLKTGALCGILFTLPIVVLSVIFGLFNIVMALLRCVLYAALSAAGGVSGVNRRERP